MKPLKAILIFLMFLNSFIGLSNDLDSCKNEVLKLQKEIDALKANPIVVHYVILKEIVTGIEKTDTIVFNNSKEFKIFNNVLHIASSKILTTFYIVDILGNIKFFEDGLNVQEYKKDLNFLENGVYLLIYIDNKNNINNRKIKIF